MCRMKVEFLPLAGFVSFSYKSPSNCTTKQEAYKCRVPQPSSAAGKRRNDKTCLSTPPRSLMYDVRYVNIFMKVVLTTSMTLYENVVLYWVWVGPEQYYWRCSLWCEGHGGVWLLVLLKKPLLHYLLEIVFFNRFSYSICCFLVLNVVRLFLIPSQKFSGVQKKTKFVFKRLFSDVFKYLDYFRFQLWNIETPFLFFAEGHQE